MASFPIIVNVGNYLGQTSGVVGGIGPFVIDQNVRYLSYAGFNGEVEDTTLALLKSTDQGLTWSAMDEANAPAFTNNNDNMSACYDGAQFIYVVWMEYDFGINKGTIKAVAFDTHTDTWGSIVVGQLTDVGSNQGVMCCWVAAASKVFIIFDNGGVVQNAAFQTFDGVSLGAASPLPFFESARGNVPIQIIDGGGGIAFYSMVTFGNPVNHSKFTFGSVDAGAGFGTVQAIADVLEAGVGFTGYMCYNPSTNLVAMAWSSPNDPDPGVRKIINVIQGESAPDVSFSQIATIVSENPASAYGSIGLGITQNGHYGLFWCASDTTFYYSDDFAAPTILGVTAAVNIGVSGFVPATSLTGYALAWAPNGYWELETAAPVSSVIAAPVQKQIILLPGTYCCETKCANGMVIGKMVLFKKRKN